MLLVLLLLAIEAAVAVVAVVAVGVVVVLDLRFLEAVVALAVVAGVVIIKGSGLMLVVMINDDCGSLAEDRVRAVVIAAAAAFFLAVAVRLVYFLTIVTGAGVAREVVIALGGTVVDNVCSIVGTEAGADVDV